MVPISTTLLRVDVQCQEEHLSIVGLDIVPDRDVQHYRVQERRRPQDVVERYLLENRQARRLRFDGLPTIPQDGPLHPLMPSLHLRTTRHPVRCHQGTLRGEHPTAIPRLEQLVPLGMRPMFLGPSNQMGQ